ncbi:MAG: phosphoenolpyruvate synthase, partial [Candidatus Micrarchaeota archaeon]|nr:phosphoenolpyruvate synthase [Candidatus Micrarchaeota archaeon]
MKNIMWFSEIRKNNLAEVGGKGANLGEMAAVGLPVPPGFVVTSGAYFWFIRHNRIDQTIKEMTEGLDVENTDQLSKASEMIKSRILGGEIPHQLRNEIINAYRSMIKDGREPYVAVRSSATAEDLPEASFAGQQSTFLNVKGAENCVQSVKECWASLFEPRSIYYRTTNKFDHLKVGLAAVVQQMVQSEKAGVMFTVDPISQNRNKLAIEAAYGLGEIVVSGATTPDRYIVDKNSMQIEVKDIAKQEWMIAKVNDQNVHVNIKEEMQARQKLTDQQIVELAKIGKRIEQHYGKPQDIEWAYAEGKMYIVQSRPITTLKAEAAAVSSVPPIMEEKPVQEVAAVQPQKKEEARGVEEKKEGEGKVLARGLGAAPGIGKGRVKVLAGPKEIGKVEKGDVLVTDMTTPDFVPAMKKASAIVTNSGGMTCHAAIVSREMGIPCVVGTKNATSVLKEGQFVTVDASRGIIYDGDVSIGEERGGAGQQAAAAQPAGVSSFSVVPTGTKIYVNLAEVELADKVARLPCDGVGLLRAEFMIGDIGEHPKKMIKEGRGQEFSDKLAEKLRIFASAFYPRPVVYRATDFKTNEYRNLKGGEEFEPQEANPMMGWRGCARYITEPDVFSLELRAIKKVRDEYNLKNLWLMLPFVRRIGEIRAIKEMLKSHGIHRTLDFKLWIMVEVPSTVFLIDQFCEEGIDGVS